MKKLILLAVFLPSVALAETMEKAPVGVAAAGADLNEPAKREPEKKQEPAKKVEFNVSTAPNSAQNPSPPVAPTFDPATKVVLTYGDYELLVKAVTQATVGQCAASTIATKVQAQLAEAIKQKTEAASQPPSPGEQKDATK